MHAGFEADGTVQVLHGIGGTGKTQAVIEYAHRHTGEYDIVWWVDAGREFSIAGQLRALAEEAGWVVDANNLDLAARTARAQLNRRPRWLLIFDNAESVAAVSPWIPHGPGHVLITSRSMQFQTIATPLAVGVFDRAESLQFLQRSLPGLDGHGAGLLAEDLGDLPLALAQAAGLLAETAMPVDEYRRQLEARADEVLAAGTVAGSRANTLKAVVDIAERRLSGDDGQGDAQALELLHLIAQFAPGKIPLAWLRPAAESTWSLRRQLGSLASMGLVLLTHDHVQMHRLVRAVINASHPRSHRDGIVARAEWLLAGVASALDADGTKDWPQWDLLLPHLLALDPAGTSSSSLRRVACQTLWVLIRRGAYIQVRDHAQRWIRAWTDDEDHKLWASTLCAIALRELGAYDEASELGASTLSRLRQLEGPDGRGTLAAANGLANVLRQTLRHAEAHDLDADTYQRRREQFGERHIDTLRSATNLALDLSALKQLSAARALHEQTLHYRKEELGEDHLDTLASRAYLAQTLKDIDDLPKAEELCREVLDNYDRIGLEDHHPDRVRALEIMAEIQIAQGHVEQATALLHTVLNHFTNRYAEDHPSTRAARRRLEAVRRQRADQRRA